MTLYHHPTQTVPHSTRHAEPLAPISPCRGSWRLRPIPLLALPPQTAGRRGRGRRTGACGDPGGPGGGPGGGGRNAAGADGGGGATDDFCPSGGEAEP